MFIGVTEEEVKKWIRQEVTDILKDATRRRAEKNAKKSLQGKILETESGEEYELVEQEVSETESASRMSG